MKRKHAIILFTVLAIILLIVDRITKIIAIEVLYDKPPIVFLPALMDFALVFNTGAAFGLFEGRGVIFVGVAALAVIAIFVYLCRAKELHLPLVIALTLIAAGALGNAYDRAVHGAVPDFLHTLFIEFPVFNMADVFLTIGEILLIVVVAYYWFIYKEPEEVSEGEAEEYIFGKPEVIASDNHEEPSQEELHPTQEGQANPEDESA